MGDARQHLVNSSSGHDADEDSSRSGLYITQRILNSINIEQARELNKTNLNDMGGPDGLAEKLGVNLQRGLTLDKVLEMRSRFGTNEFPESPMRTFLELFADAFQDLIIIILMCAAIVSLCVGLWEHPKYGWIEGTGSK
jgi:magnesium-transporting ATPase (P-type)